MNFLRFSMSAPAVAAVMALTVSAPAGAASGVLLSAYANGGSLGGYGNVKVVDSTAQWSCDGARCVLAAPLTTSLVFGSASGQPLAVTSEKLNFDLHVTPLASTLVDPLGHTWDLAVDTGKWRIGVDMASQAQPAGEAPQFATAYGQFGYVSDFFGVLPSWPVGTPLPSAGTDPTWGSPLIGEGRVLGLTESGMVSVGPGSAGMPGGPSAWDWRFQTHLDGARYAYPSTTDVHCSSLECMSYKTGIVNVNSYFLSFDVIAIPSAIPEASTFALMGLGLVGLAWGARHRRAWRHA